MQVQEVSCIFTNFCEPGLSGHYVDLLSAANAALNKDSNCICFRLELVSIIFQVFTEALFEILGVAKRVAIDVPISLIAFDFENSSTMVGKNIATLIQIIKLIVITPFLLIGVITFWPTNVVQGLCATSRWLQIVKNA